MNSQALIDTARMRVAHHGKGLLAMAMHGKESTPRGGPSLKHAVSSQ